MASTAAHALPVHVKHGLEMSKENQTGAVYRRHRAPPNVDIKMPGGLYSKGAKTTTKGVFNAANRMIDDSNSMIVHN